MQGSEEFDEENNPFALEEPNRVSPVIDCCDLVAVLDRHWRSGGRGCSARRVLDTVEVGEEAKALGSMC